VLQFGLIGYNAGMYQSKRFRPNTNVIVVAPNGERIDMRKVTKIGRMAVKESKGSRSSKYGARKVEYGGLTYHSRLEGKFAQELDIRKLAGEIKSWSRQIKIPLKVHGTPICSYYVDFLVRHNDGSDEFIEVKGFVTEVARLKMKMFEAILPIEYPNARYTVVKS